MSKLVFWNIPVKLKLTRPVLSFFPVSLSSDWSLRWQRTFRPSCSSCRGRLQPSPPPTVPSHPIQSTRAPLSRRSSRQPSSRCWTHVLFDNFDQSSEWPLIGLSSTELSFEIQRNPPSPPACWGPSRQARRHASARRAKAPRGRREPCTAAKAPDGPTSISAHRPQHLWRSGGTPQTAVRPGTTGEVGPAPLTLLWSLKVFSHAWLRV